MELDINKYTDLAMTACHNIWSDRDYFKLKNISTKDVNIIGFCEGDRIENGQFDGVNFFPFLHNTSITYYIMSEDYKTSIVSDDTVIVMSTILLSEEKAGIINYTHVFATFVIVNIEDKLLIKNAHFSSPDLIGFDTINNSLKDRPYIMSELNMSTDYYRELVENACDLFIEHDYENYELVYDKDKYQKLFNDDSYFTNPDRWFWHIINNCVHPDDCERLDLFRKVDMDKRIRNNMNHIETSFRIKNPVHGYIWVNLKLFLKFGKKTPIERMAFLFKRLDSTQFNELEYLEKSRRDDLTDLYNKTYSEYLLNKHIENISASHLSAFVLIDLDDFRLINDTFGHLTGDNIMVQFARSLNSFFGNGDLIGRLGGDKFFVLIKTMPSQYEVTKSIDNFLKSMNQTHCELGTSLDIHCSAGIVFIDENIHNFEELNKCAREALKTSKDNGKNQYTIYK